jgi:CHAP domain
MATANEFISKAAGEIGSGGAKYNTWYWGSNTGSAWCAAFQSWLQNELGGGLGWTASAAVSTVAAQLPAVADANVQPGDLVCFNWDGRTSTSWMDHIGVVEWFDHSNGYFGTIEGNTGSLSGGRVERKTRYNYGSYFTTFRRPSYGSGKIQQPSSDPVNQNNLWYATHSAAVGDNIAVRDGQISGITGQNLPIENISIDSSQVNGQLEITCILHVAYDGQLRAVKMGYGINAGTKGQAKQIEGIGLQTIVNTTGKNLYLQVHQAGYGWTATQRIDDEMTFSGATGQGRGIEAVKLWLA